MIRDKLLQRTSALPPDTEIGKHRQPATAVPAWNGPTVHLSTLVGRAGALTPGQARRARGDWG